MALIILAHPNIENSLANRTIIEELEKNAHLNLEVRNIFKLYPGFNINIKVEQAALLRHDTIVFQYPFYWYSVPAILKHWFDEVFQYQFAYGSKGDKLKDKNFVASFTVGSSEESYTALGFQHFRVLEFCKSLEQTAYHSQMRFVEPFYFYGASRSAGYSEVEIIGKAKKHASRLGEFLHLSTQKVF